jgi:hypothetical protein
MKVERLGQAMSIMEFSEWLYGTPLSTMIRDISWIIPNIQSIHILAIAALVSSALISQLRIAGAVATDVPLNQVIARHLPWFKGALVILVITGLVMVLGEPERTIPNKLFWTKMVMLFGASLYTLRSQSALVRNAVDQPASGSKNSAYLILLLWCAVIFSGRFIAYI